MTVDSYSVLEHQRLKDKVQSTGAAMDDAWAHIRWNLVEFPFLRADYEDAVKKLAEYETRYSAYIEVLSFTDTN